MRDIRPETLRPGTRTLLQPGQPEPGKAPVQPSAATAKGIGTPQGSRKTALFVAAGACALALGLGAALMGGLSPSPAPAVVAMPAPSVLSAPRPAPGPVPQAVPAPQEVTWALPADLAPSPAAVEGFLERLPPVSPETRADLQRRTVAGELRWVTLTLWDNEAEDGDVIDVHAEGVAMRLMIRHARQSYVLPVGPGGIRIIVVDGGGKTTERMRAQAFEASMGVRGNGAVERANPVTVTAHTAEGARRAWMAVGQTLHVRVR